MHLRQFIQSVLGLVFLVSSSFAFSNAEFTYNVIDGGIEITGCVDSCPSDLVIPAEIDGLIVTRIGGYAFNNNGLRNITIPDSVESIGAVAFAENLLTSVSIPDGLKVIEHYSFGGNKLVNVELPDSLTEIHGQAFAWNLLTNITLPQGLTEVDYGTFQDNLLTNVILPNTITFIDDSAFIDNNITYLNIPRSVEWIGNNAFRNNQITSLVIPYSIDFIDGYAFKNNQIENISFEGNRPQIHIDSLGFWFSPQNSGLIKDGNSFTHPSSVTDSAGFVFYNNFAYEPISFPFGGNISFTASSEQPVNLKFRFRIGSQDEDPFFETTTIEVNGVCTSYSIDIPPQGNEEFYKISMFIIERDIPVTVEKIVINKDTPNCEDNNKYTPFMNNPIEKISYRSGAIGWPGEPIESITPQQDGNFNDLNPQYSVFDLDQNGSFEALTDALILLRYAFGLRGDNLIIGAIATDANRTTAADIEAHIQSLLP
ncbi:MAG: leucine-rich repeat domain-containing protein [Porticoccaceae bacterium]